MCTLPHPSSLDRLSNKFSISSGIEQASLHREYLRQKAHSLNEKERDVCLLIDEIHVGHQVSYQGGCIEGVAVGNADVVKASTAQVSNSYLKVNFYNLNLVVIFFNRFSKFFSAFVYLRLAHLLLEQYEK